MSVELCFSFDFLSLLHTHIYYNVLFCISYIKGNVLPTLFSAKLYDNIGTETFVEMCRNKLKRIEIKKKKIPWFVEMKPKETAKKVAANPLPNSF